MLSHMLHWHRQGDPCASVHPSMHAKGRSRATSTFMSTANATETLAHRKPAGNGASACWLTCVQRERVASAGAAPAARWTLDEHSKGYWSGRDDCRQPGALLARHSARALRHIQHTPNHKPFPLHSRHPRRLPLSCLTPLPCLPPFRPAHPLDLEASCLRRPPCGNPTHQHFFELVSSLQQLLALGSSSN